MFFWNKNSLSLLLSFTIIEYENLDLISHIIDFFYMWLYDIWSLIYIFPRNKLYKSWDLDIVLWTSVYSLHKPLFLVILCQMIFFYIIQGKNLPIFSNKILTDIYNCIVSTRLNSFHHDVTKFSSVLRTVCALLWTKSHVVDWCWFYWV